jgi:NDP-sugar pyrophosphorylase family protein
VLTAGLGTRLRPLTDERAKPAMPVAGAPLIRRIISWLAAQGIRDLVLNLHSRPETLTTTVGDGSDLGVRVRYSWEQPRVLGSAGGARKALPILGAETFLVVNGDTLTDLGLTALAAAHADSGALATLALVPNREYERYGGVTLDTRNHVLGFTRKGPASRDTWHFIGVQIVHASVFASLPADEPRNTVGDVYDELVRRRPGSVRGCRCDAAFWDIGTPGDYLRTSLALSGTGVDAGQGTTIHPSARVARSVLWDDVEVGESAQLEGCIAADGVRVPPGARYADSILMQRDGVLTVTHLDP